MDGILLTHGHWDHIYGLDSLKADFPEAPVYIYEEDWGFLTTPHLNCSVTNGFRLLLQSEAKAVTEDELNIGGVSRAAYYKWLNRKTPESELENRKIATLVEEIHNESADKGYRRIRDELERYYGIDVNDKRILRICRSLGIKSTIKYANDGCTRQSSNPHPQFIAENILNREFTAEAPNQKWLTDITEFHYYIGIEKHKV